MSFFRVSSLICLIWETFASISAICTTTNYASPIQVQEVPRSRSGSGAPRIKHGNSWGAIGLKLWAMGELMGESSRYLKLTMTRPFFLWGYLGTNNVKIVTLSFLSRHVWRWDFPFCKFILIAFAYMLTLWSASFVFCWHLINIYGIFIILFIYVYLLCVDHIFPWFGMFMQYFYISPRGHPYAMLPGHCIDISHARSGVPEEVSAH